jgi:hypothetical protein
MSSFNEFADGDSDLAASNLRAMLPNDAVVRVRAEDFNRVMHVVVTRVPDAVGNRFWSCRFQRAKDEPNAMRSFSFPLIVERAMETVWPEEKPSKPVDPLVVLERRVAWLERKLADLTARFDDFEARHHK